MELKIEEIYKEEVYIISTFFSRGYGMQEIKYLLEGSSVIEVLANKIHQDIWVYNRAIKNTNKKIENNEKEIAKILNKKIEKDIKSCIIEKIEFAIETLENDTRTIRRKEQIIKQLKDDKRECERIIKNGEEQIILPKEKGCIYKVLEYTYRKSLKNI